MSAISPSIESSKAPLIRPKTSKDDRIMSAFMLVIGLYLIVTLAFPLYAMLSKSFSTFAFDLGNFEFQVNQGEGWSAPHTAKAINDELQVVKADELATSSDGRLSVTTFFPDFSFRSPTRYKLRQIKPESSFLVGSNRFTDTEWHEFESNEFRRVVLRPSSSTGLENYRAYFTTPALFRSIGNSLTIAAISTIITVALAFGFAYALNRSTMRFKGVFRLVAMIPILVPSLLPGIALVYLFGNQGMLKAFLFGESIYGPIGIVTGFGIFYLSACINHHNNCAGDIRCQTLRGSYFTARQSLENFLDGDNTRCEIRFDFGRLRGLQSGHYRFWFAQGYRRSIQHARGRYI